jgi:iron-sulfur cluster assembly protein
MNSSNHAPEGVRLTQQAAEAVQELFEKRDMSPDDFALRLFVQDGGCSGYQYGMALDRITQDNDQTFVVEGLKLVVDGNSLGYLQGAVIDYQEDIMHSGFKIENPNAVSSCSCGDSFRSESRRKRGRKSQQGSCRVGR